MKTYQLIFLAIITSLFLFCSQATEPSKSDYFSEDIKIELLKRIYLLDVSKSWKWEELNYYKRTGKDLVTWYTEHEFIQKLKSELDNLDFSRSGILLLAASQLDEAEQLLFDVLKNANDQFLRFNAARALAYRKKKDGLDLLYRCAAGDLVLTSSELERHDAALALLLLGERLPQEYLNSGFADPLYVKLSN
ncbi:MAG: hypothetical protein ONB13_05995 [candidate division KSB1 bacterium]|nr:hypothetical protein [candidate division KSB1 bacterium]